MEKIKESLPSKFIKRKNLINHGSEQAKIKEFELLKEESSKLNFEDMAYIDDEIQLPDSSKIMSEYIDTKEKLNTAVLALKNERMIGIDVEHTNSNSYQGYICLIQISTIKTNYIIDAIELYDLISEMLTPIFLDPKIVKIFYAGGSDVLWLNRDFGLNVINFFDIHLASVYIDKARDTSLVGLLKKYCNYEMDRAAKKKFQVSDWRVRPLTSEQLQYAVIDSFFLIYLRKILIEDLKQHCQKEKIEQFLISMQAQGLKLYELRPINFTTFADYFEKEYIKLSKSISEIEKIEILTTKQAKMRIFLTICKVRDEYARRLDENPESIITNQEIFNLSLRDSFLEELKNLEAFRSDIDKISALFHEDQLFDLKDIPKKFSNTEEREKLKEGRRKKIEDNLTSKKRQLYEFCAILAPDGQVLSHCDKAKAKWYVSKGLAKLLSEEPYQIQLLFEPSGRQHNVVSEFGIENSEYVKETRQNLCVVCGQTDSLLKYHVVPSLYRQHFPKELKEHSAYDVVIMCMRCLDKANKETHKKVLEISVKYGVSANESSDLQKLNANMENIRKLVLAYSTNKESLPKERRTKLKISIRENVTQILDGNKLDQIDEIFKKFVFKENGKLKIEENFIVFFKEFKSIKDYMKNTGADFKNLHGKAVIDKLGSVAEIRKFAQDWRDYFIEYLNPQYLPYDWRLSLKKKQEAILTKNS